MFSSQMSFLQKFCHNSVLVYTHLKYREQKYKSQKEKYDVARVRGRFDRRGSGCKLRNDGNKRCEHIEVHNDPLKKY